MRILGLKRREITATLSALYAENNSCSTCSKRAQKHENEVHPRTPGLAEVSLGSAQSVYPVGRGPPSPGPSSRPHGGPGVSAQERGHARKPHRRGGEIQRNRKGEPQLRARALLD